MRKFVILLVSFIGILMVTASFSADLKIGVVDFQKIAIESSQAKDINAKMKKEITPYQDNLASKQKGLKKLLDKKKRDALVMRAQDKKNLDNEINKNGSEYNVLTQKYQKKLMLLQQTAMQELGKSVSSAINKVEKKDHLNIVLLRSSVPYFDSSMDITDQVMKKMD